MITFYRHTFETLGGAFWRVRFWAHDHPRWSKVIAVVLIDLFLVLFGNTYWAFAADGGGSSPFMLGGDITDSDGVPLTNYTVLPLDRGDVFTMGKFFISMWIDPIWTGHLGLVSWMIWFCNWLLSFEWVDIVAAPFGALADLLQDFLGEIAWIPFALTIAGGVAGLAIMLGRHSTGWAELFISACCAVLATGLLANPIASLTAAGGAFDTAQEYGGQIAAVVVTDDINSTELDSENLLSAAVTSQLVDIFVKIPAQTIAFGHALEGQCAATFTDTMTNSAPIQTGGNEVRDAVGGCDEAAKTFNQNPNFGQVLTAVTMTPGALTLFILPMAFGVLFLVTVLGFLISALKTMWNVYIGILPVNRYPLWKSLADTFMGLVAIVFMAVVMAAVLKLTVAAITGLSSLGIPLVAQMTFATLVMIVLLFLIIRARRIAKKTGRSIAEQLSKYGIGKGAPAQRNGVKTVAAMSAVSTVAAAALRRPDNKVDARSINFGAGAAQDIGTMTATRPPAAPKPPSTPSGGSPSRPALPSPQMGSGGGAGAGAAAKASKTADLVFTAARIGKGAAAGGVAGAAGAAALEVGGRVASKGASKAVSAAAAGASKPRAAGDPKVVSMVVDQGPAPTRTPDGPRRIVVDSSGMGHIERRPSSGVVDISSLPARAPRSPRSGEMRARLAIAQK